MARFNLRGFWGEKKSIFIDPKNLYSFREKVLRVSTNVSGAMMTRVMWCKQGYTFSVFSSTHVFIPLPFCHMRFRKRIAFVSWIEAKQKKGRHEQWILHVFLWLVMFLLVHVGSCNISEFSILRQYGVILIRFGNNKEFPVQLRRMERKPNKPNNIPKQFWLHICRGCSVAKFGKAWIYL